MFLRIIRGDKDHTYECDYVLVTGESPMLEIEIGKYHVSGALRTFTIDKTSPESLGIYSMNDAGKTIETHFQKNED